jgi:hypothetical protein
MEIKVKDTNTGVIYSNDMAKGNKHTILEIHFCTSYTQVKVQDEEVNEVGGNCWPKHDIIIPSELSKVNWVDMIAVQNDPIGEWVL